MSKNKSIKGCVLVLLAGTVLAVNTVAFGKTSTAGSNFGYTDDGLEAQVATLMKLDNNQRRSSLTYNSILAQAARRKAFDMGRRRYFEHESPEGVYYYDIIARAGYEASGSGECIEAGSQTAEGAWNAWMNSPGHRKILLGLSSDTFFAANVEYGIGHAYVPGSPLGHYWVAIVAAPKRLNGSSGFNFTDPFTSNTSSGSGTDYSHVIRGADGKLRPASGYVWLDKNDPNDFRVKLMTGLIKENGEYRPAAGYTWVNPDNPRDLRVEPIQ